MINQVFLLLIQMLMSTRSIPTQLVELLVVMI